MRRTPVKRPKRARVRRLKNLVRRGLLRRLEGDRWQFTHALGYRFARDEEGSDVDLRQRLGHGLHAYLVAAMAAAGSAEALTSLGRALEHAAALLRADPDQQLWDALAQELLYDIADRLEELGRLDLTSLALGAVQDWLARFPAPKADEPYWLGERCNLIVDQGDVLRAQGDLAGAQAAYRESLAVSRRLAEADPSNAVLQRDLGMSHSKVGNVLRDQGDLVGAQEAYREALAVMRRLAEADPSNAGRQRDFGVSQGKVGDVLHDQGDPDGALEAYRDARVVIRRLVEADPSKALWRRDLGTSQERIGDMLRDQGDPAGALEAYGEALAVRRRLAKSDPSNAVWQRDLSFILTRLAQFHEQQGAQTEALPLAEESLEIDERLAVLDRSNVNWQRDVAVSRALVDRLHGGVR